MKVSVSLLASRFSGLLCDVLLAMEICAPATACQEKRIGENAAPQPTIV